MMSLKNINKYLFRLMILFISLFPLTLISATEIIEIPEKNLNSWLESLDTIQSLENSGQNIKAERVKKALTRNLRDIFKIGKKYRFTNISIHGDTIKAGRQEGIYIGVAEAKSFIIWGAISENLAEKMQTYIAAIDKKTNYDSKEGRVCNIIIRPKRHSGVQLEKGTTAAHSLSGISLSADILECQCDVEVVPE